ncbi:NFIL3-like protein [Mya arenaria]|uniref:NFIL3-like protein n=1 Tax=Mya arenaria TaxID=6604 RepID=A0ABY7FP13_MYAAR|nr:NFIL3-like protein [Mya arenaria]
MTLLDTSSRSSGTSSRLITAMLAERPYQPAASTTSFSQASNLHSGIHSRTYIMNVDPSSASQYKEMFMSNASYADTDSRPAMAKPTVNNMADNQVSDSGYRGNNQISDSGYRSYDDENGYTSGGYIPSRKQREFIPDNKKDDGYWEKRKKNNEAARRSREKRRVHDMALENRILELTRDNCKIRNELNLVKKKFGLSTEEVFTADESQMGKISSQNSSPPQSFARSQQPSVPSEYPSPIYSNGILLPQSPIRSRSVSGPNPSQYPVYSQPSSSPPIHHAIPSSSDSFFSRAQSDAEFKINSGKYEAQYPYQMKSMKDESHNYKHRVDDQVRPLYSTTMPPNQISPYSGGLPVSAHKSYWIPTTDLTSSDSNDEPDYYDKVQEQPLSLVKKRPSTENESSEDMSNSSSRASNSPNTSLPLKLRRKMTNDESNTSFSSVNALPYPNGLAQLSEIALSQSNLPDNSYDDIRIQSSLESFNSRPRSYSNPRALFDMKYVERRRRNNEAARKCRENRKQITRIREVKSGYLENENDKLKDELVNLQDEMKELRDMLEKKQKEREDNNENNGNQNVDSTNIGNGNGESNGENVRIKNEDDMMDEQ